MDNECPEDHQTPDSKEEQGTLTKANNLAPLAGVVIQLIELPLKVGIFRGHGVFIELFRSFADLRRNGNRKCGASIERRTYPNISAQQTDDAF